MISEQPDLAAHSSIYALADSLAKLIDEMAGEGVDPDTITSLDVSDQSGHWERAQKFVAIAQRFLELRQITPDSTLVRRISVLSSCTSSAPPTSQRACCLLCWPMRISWARGDSSAKCARGSTGRWDRRRRTSGRRSHRLHKHAWFGSPSMRCWCAWTHG